MIVGVHRHIWLVIAAFYLGLLQGLWQLADANGGHVHLGGIFFLLLGGIVFLGGTGAIFYMLFRAGPEEVEPEDMPIDDRLPDDRQLNNRQEDPENE